MVTWSKTDKTIWSLQICNISHENTRGVADCDEINLGDILYCGMNEWNWYYYYYYY
jgi:hypothetical protein